jgi:hypothetical protein
MPTGPDFLTTSPLNQSGVTPHSECNCPRIAYIATFMKTFSIPMLELLRSLADLRLTSA